MASSAKYVAIPVDESEEHMHPGSSDLPRDSVDEEPGQDDPLLSRTGKARYHDDEDSAESPTEQAGIVPRFLSWSRKTRHTGRHSGRRCWWWPSLKTKDERRTWLIRFSFGSMVITIIVLIITVAVLATRPVQYRSYPYYPDYRAKTHLPHANRITYSRNFVLDFPATYPPLKNTSSSQCRAAWSKLTYIPCHEKIWNRSWDNGTQLSLFEPQIKDYTEAICGGSCLDRINQAYGQISDACSADDTFNMETYVGPFLADPKLEAGPVAALETIRRRIQHTCRTDGSSLYPGVAYYCAAILYSDWYIVDGINAGVLSGLDMFDHLTATNRTDLRYDGQLSEANFCDGISFGRYRTGRTGNVIKHGPGVGETTCGECLLGWFERKMMSWSKDETVDPDTGKPMPLPDLLHRVSRLGRRCETGQWNMIYSRTIAKYKSYGLLPPDWKDEGSSE